MELVLPNNYVEIEEEEMMYLDGGWSCSVFVKNLYGLAERGGVIYTAIDGISRYLGKKNIKALKTLKASLSWVAGKVSWAIGRVVSLIGGFWTGFLVGMGSFLAISYLGNYRVFY